MSKIMNIKQGFAYMNALTKWLNEANRVLVDRDGAINVTRLHKRSAAYSSAEDWVEVVEKDIDIYNPMDVFALIEQLIDEKDAVAYAISKAKADNIDEFDIDSSLSTVKAMRETASYMKMLLRIKGGTRTVSGQDYAFNNEGNQMPYRYDIEETLEENFDRAAIKTSLKELLGEADALSNDIEGMMIDTELDFSPRFDVNSTFDDLMDLL